MAIFHLLDFGSGFDDMLLTKTGKGALLGWGGWSGLLCEVGQGDAWG